MSTQKPTAADNGWEKSAGPWVRLMEQGDPNRVLLLDEVMLGLCGDVRGRDVLDVGCGEGRFCRMLAARGAKTTGVDPTKALIAEARRQQPEGAFHEAGGEALPLPDASMDLVVSYVSLVDIPDFRSAIREMARVVRPGGRVVSYVSLVDIPDFRAAIREMARVVRPGGRVVVANLNGFITATTRFWARDEMNNKLHWTMDNYTVERPNRAEWAGISVVNWHRPQSAYLQAFLGAGLRLEHFDEPQPKPEALKVRPDMNDFRRAPLFCTMVWRAV